MSCNKGLAGKIKREGLASGRLVEESLTEMPTLEVQGERRARRSMFQTWGLVSAQAHGRKGHLAF